MPRTFMNYRRAKEVLLAHLAKSDQQFLSFDKDFKHFEEVPALRVACRYVRILANGITSFDRATRESVGNIIYKNVIVPGPTADTARVYTNLSLNTGTGGSAVNGDDLAQCTPYTFGPELLETFAAGVMSDLADPKKCKAWEGTRRTIKRLKRSEVMPVARALTRYTNMVELGYSDHQIRDKADAIIENFKPMELIEANTPSDFIEMYSTGPESCMTPYESRSWYFLLNSGTHPTAFFAYHPHTKGIYIKKRTKHGDNDVAARCMVYEQADGKWYYGRIYTNGSTSIQAKFIANLEAQGYLPLEDGSFDREATFTIPGTYIDSDAFDEAEDDDDEVCRDHVGDYACVMPYFDNLTCNIEVAFDKATKTFNVKTGNRVSGNVDLSSTSGYVTAGKVTVVRCAECEERIYAGGERYNHQSNGNVYCSTECVRDAGHVIMIRSDGREVVRDIDENSVQDIFSPSRYWTNQAAAERRGASPCSRGLLIQDEEPGMSANAVFARDPDGTGGYCSNDTYFRITQTNLWDTNIYRLTVSLRQLTELEMEFKTVTAMTADFSKPLVITEGQMVVPAGFKAVLGVRDRFAVDTAFSDVHFGTTATSLPMFVQELPRMADAA